MNRQRRASASLYDAQADLDALQADLPRFEGLVQTNGASAQRMENARCPAPELASARAAAIAARELLEQHETEILAAETEVRRLTRDAGLPRRDTSGPIEAALTHVRRQRRELLNDCDAIEEALLAHLLSRDKAAGAIAHAG